ncbi:MAG: N-acetylmuramoyl-L-alanine amidase-like domain-containing protein [Planctomycetota bacterium]
MKRFWTRHAGAGLLAVGLLPAGGALADEASQAAARPDATSLGLSIVAPQSAPLTEFELAICEEHGLKPEKIAELKDRPLYTYSEAEVDAYLRFLHASMPKLADRVGHLARKNIGQPYELYLLGEAPFEVYDPQPIYCLDRSDCVVFVEHTYAMALSWDWPTFMAVLQRIRYIDGEIGVLTRNHYTEADWNPSNQWLVRDMTDRLPRRLTDSYTIKIDRARFFKNRYELETGHELEHLDVSYVPVERVMDIAGRLREGDFVNFVYGHASTSGGDPACWVGHVGLIVIEDGEPHLLHSAAPRVRMEPLAKVVERVMAGVDERDAAGKRRTFGFKFHRLAADPWANLRSIDGPEAPRVTVPGPFAAPGELGDRAQARR